MIREKHNTDKEKKNQKKGGKSALGIITGKFENTYQINEAIRSGGILDSTSDLLDNVIDKLEYKGKINPTVSKIIMNGVPTLVGRP